MDNSNSVMSVSSLNNSIKYLLYNSFQNISVEGEISSVTYHYSGHIYFSIKDESSLLKCIMWKSQTYKLKFRLQTGTHIIVHGSINVYTPRGEYQLIASNIEPYGIGALALAFEQLKEKLSQKGYFDSRYKKPIPKYPKSIAIVTSKDGAALQDMLKIASRRYPLVDIKVFDTAVQGYSASFEIADSIKRADKYGVDVIIVGRGGGSLEDLWAFNEEVVADAIFNAKTPIVSAVGHEVDVMISDLVADLRAPTPSAAMELILPDINEILYTLDDIFDRLTRRINDIIYLKDEKVTSLKISIKNHSAHNRLKLLEETLKSLRYKLDESIKYRVFRLEDAIKPIKDNLNDTLLSNLRAKEDRVDSLMNNLTLNNPYKLANKRLKSLEESFNSIEDKLSEAIRYKISKLEDSIEPLENNLRDTILSKLRVKESIVDNLSNSLSLNNPSKKVREGWGEIVKDGRRVPLSDISIGEEFEIYDGRNMVRVKVIDKR